MNTDCKHTAPPDHRHLMKASVKWSDLYVRRSERKRITEFCVPARRSVGVFVCSLRNTKGLVTCDYRSGVAEANLAVVALGGNKYEAQADTRKTNAGQEITRRQTLCCMYSLCTWYTKTTEMILIFNTI